MANILNISCCKVTTVITGDYVQPRSAMLTYSGPAALSNITTLWELNNFQYGPAKMLSRMLKPVALGDQGAGVVSGITNVRITVVRIFNEFNSRISAFHALADVLVQGDK